MEFDSSAWCAEMLAATAPATGNQASGATQSPEQQLSDETASASPPPVQGSLDIDDIYKAVGQFRESDTCSTVPQGQQSGSEELAPDVAQSISDVVEEVEPRPWPSDQVYDQWIPHIWGPLAPLRRLRGGFKAPVSCGSMYGGASSDRKVLELFGVPTVWQFEVEQKHSAISFTEMNFNSRPTCHFLDATDFLHSDFGTDLFAGLEKVDIKRFHNKVRLLFVSSSCCPFSTTRSFRKSKGTKSHGDNALIDAYFEVAKKVDADATVFEQIFGFALAESRSDSQSPLVTFLRRAEVELPEQESMVFMAEGDTFLLFARHRIYIVLLKRSCGGRASLNLLKTVVQDSENLSLEVIVTPKLPGNSDR